MPPVNDNFASAMDLGGSFTGGPITGNNVGATHEPFESNAQGTYLGPGNGNTVWYKWSPARTFPTNAIVDVEIRFASTYNGSIATYVQIFQTATPPGVGSGDASFRSFPISFNTLDVGSLITFQAVGGSTYYIQVDSVKGGVRGNFSFSWGPLSNRRVADCSQAQPQFNNLIGTVTVDITDQTGVPFNGGPQQQDPTINVKSYPFTDCTGNQNLPCGIYLLTYQYGSWNSELDQGALGITNNWFINQFTAAAFADTNGINGTSRTFDVLFQNPGLAAIQAPTFDPYFYYVAPTSGQAQSEIYGYYCTIARDQKNNFVGVPTGNGSFATQQETEIFALCDKSGFMYHSGGPITLRMYAPQVPQSGSGISVLNGTPPPTFSLYKLDKNNFVVNAVSFWDNDTQIIVEFGITLINWPMYNGQFIVPIMSLYATLDQTGGVGSPGTFRVNGLDGNETTLNFDLGFPPSPFNTSMSQTGQFIFTPNGTPRDSIEITIRLSTGPNGGGCLIGEFSFSIAPAFTIDSFAGSSGHKCNSGPNTYSLMTAVLDNKGNIGPAPLAVLTIEVDPPGPPIDYFNPQVGFGSPCGNNSPLSISGDQGVGGVIGPENILFAAVTTVPSGIDAKFQISDGVFNYPLLEKVST